EVFPDLPRDGREPGGQRIRESIRWRGARRVRGSGRERRIARGGRGRQGVALDRGCSREGEEDGQKRRQDERRREAMDYDPLPHTSLDTRAERRRVHAEVPIGPLVPAHRPVCPKPPSPLVVSLSSGATSSAARTTGANTSCAIRSPRRTT